MNFKGLSAFAGIFILIAAVFMAGAPLEALAARTFLSASINNGASTVTVASGASIPASVTVQTSGTGTADDWKSTGWRIGTTTGAYTCIDTTDRTTAGTYTTTFNMQAPAIAGTYNVYFTAYNISGCSSSGTAGSNGPKIMANAVVVTPPPTITITPDTLGSAMVGATYSQSLTASTTLTGTITWSVSSGTLPAGITLPVRTGKIISFAGKPTTAGTYAFSIRAVSGTISSTKNYTLVVSPVIPISISPSTLATPKAGNAYMQTLTASTAAVGPFTWSVTSGTSLPTGLVLGTSTGLTNTISGTPTVSGEKIFSITVTNGMSVGIRSYTVTVGTPAPITITPATLASGMVGIAYSQTVTGSTTGTSPITWSISSGTLPTGLAINTATGVISGTPTASGSRTFTVQASNGATSAAKSYTVTIAAAPAVTINPSALQTATIGRAYSQTLIASTTAVGPFIWSLASGTLPTGLSLATSTGVISGTPTVIGSKTFIVHVTNGFSTATKTYTLSPAPIPAITLAPGALVSGTSTLPYSQTLTASTTAVGPFTWSVTSGSLPAGLSLGASNTATNSISGTPTASETASFSITVTNGESSVTQNYSIVVSATPPPQSNNMILNPSFETETIAGTPDHWKQGGWGSNNAVFSYPVSGNGSAKSANISITSYTDGDAKWYFDDVAIVPGETYAFSDSYKSNVQTIVMAQYTLAGGALQYEQIVALPSSNDAWALASGNFVAPANAVSVTIFHILASIGSLTIDDASLQSSAPLITLSPAVLVSGTQNSSYSQTLTAVTGATGSFAWSVSSGSLPAGLSLGASNTATNSISGTPTASETASFSITVVSGASSVTKNYSITVEPAVVPTSNLILNPSFETALGSLPLHWKQGGWGANDAIFTYPAAGNGSAKAASITIGSSYVEGDAKWYFDDVPVQENTAYTFSDAYKSTVPTHLVAQFTGSTGAVTYAEIKTAPATGGVWSSIQAPIVTPPGAVSVTLFHLINSVGSLTIDDASLVLGVTSNPQDLFSKGLVSLTFDDGWQSQFDNAMPVLNAANIKGTFYIIENMMLQSEFEVAYMSTSTVLSLQNTYGHEIGSHTMDHCNMVALYNDPNSASSTGCPDTQVAGPSSADYQIAQSRTMLQALTGAPVDSFAYPYGAGAGHAGVEAIVNAAGYTSARSVGTGYNTKTTSKTALMVQNVGSSVTDFNATVKPWIDYAAANKVWLILMFHQVEPTAEILAAKNEPDGTTAGMIQNIAAYLSAQQAAGSIQVETMHNVMANYMN